MMGRRESRVLSNTLITRLAIFVAALCIILANYGYYQRHYPTPLFCAVGPLVGHEFEAGECPE